MALDKQADKTVLYNISSLQQNIYQHLGLVCSLPVAESESREYGAYTFKAGEKKVIYRIAKITPTKVGQFVTVWKRLGNGPIQPYSDADDIDFFIISVIHNDLQGQFIFPKSILLAKGILSNRNKEGKRGFRVYPPWDKAINKQAQHTQQWQLQYFIDSSGGLFQHEKAAVLLNKQ